MPGVPLSDIVIGLERATTVDPRLRVSLTVLRAAYVIAPAILLLDVTISLLSGTSPLTASRVSYIVTIGVAVWQLRRPRPNALWLMYPVAYGLLLLSSIDNATGLNVGSLTPPVTTAVVVTIGLIMGVVGARRWLWHAAALVTTTVAWTVFITTHGGFPAEYAILQGTVAGVTLMVGAWLVHWAATELERRAAEAKRLALFHEAIATCSEYLHDDGGEAPEEALRALLQASDAESVFVSRNVDDPLLGLCSSILREVYAEGASQADEEDRSLVPWANMPYGHDAMTAGRSIYYRLADTSPEERALHAGRDVEAECNIPIMIDGEWHGTLGFSYSAKHPHSPSDIELLETAARIFGASWKGIQQRADLQQLLRSKDELVTAVSHELRTPLTGILGFAEAILEAEPPDQRELIELIAGQSRDMSDIIDDLLVSARVEAGTLVVRQSDVRLGEIAANVAAVFRDRLSTGQVVLPVRSEPLIARGDPVRVRQIVRNLLSNAIAHGGDRIQIRVHGAGGQARLGVWDSGRIRSDDTDRLFERFYTGQSPGPTPGSVGIGLFLSRRLARLMGGDISVDASDAGTEFTLVLPMAPQPVDAVAAAGHTDG